MVGITLVFLVKLNLGCDEHLTSLTSWQSQPTCCHAANQGGFSVAAYCVGEDLGRQANLLLLSLLCSGYRFVVQLCGRC